MFSDPFKIATMSRVDMELVILDAGFRFLVHKCADWYPRYAFGIDINLLDVCMYACMHVQEMWM